MTYGNFYYGKDGFFYKKNQNIGARWNPSIGLICNQPQNIYNSFVSGSGVGAVTTANRRAKLIHATKCLPDGTCNTRLGLYSKYNTGNPTFAFNWYVPT